MAGVAMVNEEAPPLPGIPADAVGDAGEPCRAELSAGGRSTSRGSRDSPSSGADAGDAASGQRRPKRRPLSSLVGRWATGRRSAPPAEGGGAEGGAEPEGEWPTRITTDSGASSPSADVAAEAWGAPSVAGVGLPWPGGAYGAMDGRPELQSFAPARRPSRAQLRGRPPSALSGVQELAEDVRPAEAPSGPTPADVERLIAQCMTQERPTALVKASAALLDACSLKLGQEGAEGEKRSDKIRRMLRLTDELRCYNATLAEQGVPMDSACEEEASADGP